MKARRPDALPDLLVIDPEVHEDDRGIFLEAFHQDRYANAGLDWNFVQDNHSRSRRGVLRGLHYQHPSPQGKLIQVVRGEIFDVAVDIRRGSPSFGEWYGLRLDDLARRQVWIPPDFAHGYLTLSGTADVYYKCTGYYEPEARHVLIWNDPSVGVRWPNDDPILSERDRAGDSLETLAAEGALPEYRG